MKAFILSAVLSAALWGQTTSYAGDAPAVHPSAARPFTVLPAGTRFPEGIALDRRTGDLYVGTFDLEGNNKLLRFSVARIRLR
jgi:hypothetical protein